MPVPMTQLASTTGAISTSVSSTVVCVVTYAVLSVPSYISCCYGGTAVEAEEGDGSCRTGIDVGELPGLVGFREVCALDRNFFCSTAATRHPSCQSRIIVGVGSSGCCRAVFVISGVAPSFPAVSRTLASPAPSALPDPARSSSV